MFVYLIFKKIIVINCVYEFMSVVGCCKMWESIS